jgi:iron complex outermembrane receptor protein
MSELINSRDSRATIRWKLLTGVSALALVVSSASIANAEDSGQPQIWIELGGQLSRLDDGQETFAPAFPESPPRPSIFSPSQKFEKPPLYGLDEDGKISYQPEGSDWIFSASIRYGRSSANRRVHQQTTPATYFKYNSTGKLYDSAIPGGAKFTDTAAQTSEKYLLLDFQAGKDVGLGLFGGKTSSVVSLGVRFAQFSTRSNIALKSVPDWHFHYKYVTYASIDKNILSGQVYHSNRGELRATRSFRGVGPSLSWSNTTPFAGDLQDGELALDWGINAALLFGRQKVRTHHQTTTLYHNYKYHTGVHVTVGTPVSTNHTRSRNVIVPNVGGSVGLSYRMEDFKVSFGYRADMFFGAMDGGIDTRKDENRGFYGPFASVSVGLGD